MLDTQAQRLREHWGEKPCSHPRFVKEYYRYRTRTSGKLWDYNTGDFVCTTCGKVFTPAERNTIVAGRKK